METFNEILTKIESNQNLNELNIYLSQLDLLIKENKSFRESTPDRFYLVTLNCLDNLLSSNENNWIILRQLTKCIKNSAASFKNEFTTNELKLCEYLIDFISKNLSNSILTRNESNEDKQNFFINLFQYFFNLIQGNKKAYDSLIEIWANLCIQMLLINDLKQNFYDLASMILIYGCLEKENKSYILNINSIRIDLNVYINLLNRLDEYLFLAFENKETSKEIDMTNEKLKNWTFKILNFYFDHFYFNYLIRNARYIHEQLSIKNRLFILEILNDKIINFIESFNSKNEILNLNKIEYSYLKKDSIEFISEFYTSSSGKLLSLINDIESNESKLTEICDYIKEVKLLLNSLCDLLTVEERHFTLNLIKQNVYLVQNQIDLFENTCKLFKEIHVNKIFINLIEKFTKINNQESYFINIKCELVRLIGILVYENTANQNYLVKDQLLHIISSNLDIDIDNPFVREWSIVALKHILSNLDFR